MIWNTSQTRLIDGFGPLPVIRPESVAEVQEIVRQAAARGEAVYPVGGGTLLNLGWSPTRPGVAVDLTGLSQVVDYPARDMTITVQAGITLEKLQSLLAAERQRLPVDVPLPGRSSLGGALAANVSGPRRFGFGTFRDYVIGISVVNDRGEVIKAGGRVVKNVAGYDLCKLYVGSLGTLGIIVQVTLKVRPVPEASVLLAVPVSGQKLAEALDRIHASRTRPCAIELLSPATADRMGFSTRDWLLLIGYEDNRAAVAWQVEQLARELGEISLAANRIWRDGDSQEIWAQLTDWPLGGDAQIVCKASVLPSRTASFCCLTAAVIPDAEILVHAGSGIVLGRLRDMATASEVLLRLRNEVKTCGGSVILLRCPPELKPSLDVWGEAHEAWPLMAEIKAKLDPADLFNPGRFVFKPPGSSPSPR
ncbi:MAG: FAD-binding oxidoreductase [Gemmatales bacterium]|nr:FAD-binding oxidoreductase [Gemmatales bacterium]MDW8385851.1 FAD-binding oxidoreductase [Gemmatales bacterium]